MSDKFDQAFYNARDMNDDTVTGVRRNFDDAFRDVRLAMTRIEALTDKIAALDNATRFLTNEPQAPGGGLTRLALPANVSCEVDSAALSALLQAEINLRRVELERAIEQAREHLERLHTLRFEP